MAIQRSHRTAGPDHFIVVPLKGCRQITAGRIPAINDKCRLSWSQPTGAGSVTIRETALKPIACGTGGWWFEPTPLHGFLRWAAIKSHP